MLYEDLMYEASYEELMCEFFWYLEHTGECKLFQQKNKIIKFFQQDMFFKTEKELWKDDAIKEKMILNRCKYLNKSVDELTENDILNGFKRSGLYYGYSGFNPLLAKWFYEKYHVLSCYDPCGGWGHRMLGSTELDLYIYNDLSKTVAENVQNIKDYFGFDNTVIYTNDASTFIPSKNYDAIFTCPPYYNLEHYECGDFENIEQFEKLLDGIFAAFDKSCCKVMGIVILDELMKNHNNFTEKINLTQKKANHINKSKNIKKNESLFIFKK